MAGLLGDSLEDPRTMALFALAQGLSGNKRLLPGLLQGAQGYGATMASARQQEEQRKRGLLQEQLIGQQIQQSQAAMAEQAAQRTRKTQDDSILRDSFAPMAGPMPDGSAGVAPRFDLGALLGRGLSMDSVPEALKLNQAINPMAAKPETKVVGNALVQVGPEGAKELYRAPDAPEKKPEALRALALVYGENSPEYATAARQYAQKLTTHQPGTSVSVNTGQKGLDNTLKVRGDFRSEPVYKAHQEMQSAYAQIKQSLAQASPAGDLAGATKLMKLLDPGSVVRESELGMAMAASGLMDRVENYANKIITGEKLTPTQRVDFKKLADALYSESEKQYGSKRKEYEGLAQRNGLNVDDILGPAPAAQKPDPAPAGALSPAEQRELIELRKKLNR